MRTQRVGHDRRMDKQNVAGLQRRFCKNDLVGRGRQVRVAGEVAPIARKAGTEKAWQCEAA